VQSAFRRSGSRDHSPGLALHQVKIIHFQVMENLLLQVSPTDRSLAVFHRAQSGAHVQGFLDFSLAS